MKENSIKEIKEQKKETNKKINKSFFSKIILWIPIYFVFYMAFNSGNVKFNVNWIKDINIWVNEIITQFLIFIFLSAILIKVKSLSLNFIISFIVSIFIGNFFVWEVDTSLSTWLWLVASIIMTILIVFLAYSSYKQGFLTGRNKTIKKKEEIKLKIQKMSNEEYVDLLNAQRLIKNNRKSVELIDRYGIDNIKTIIEIKKTLNKENKNYKKNSETKENNETRN